MEFAKIFTDAAVSLIVVPLRVGYVSTVRSPEGSVEYFKGRAGQPDKVVKVQIGAATYRLCLAAALPQESAPVQLVLQRN